MTITRIPTQSESFPQGTDIEWVPFSGGELEAPRPSARCEACRRRPTSDATWCFECYRAGRAREQAFSRAAALDTASEARFQSLLPFEPVNRARLEKLRATRADARTRAQAGTDRFADRRRRAQIAARHALERIGTALTSRGLTLQERTRRERQLAFAVHAAELQLPDAWLPFVVSY